MTLDNEIIIDRRSSIFFLLNELAENGSLILPKSQMDYLYEDMGFIADVLDSHATYELTNSTIQALLDDWDITEDYLETITDIAMTIDILSYPSLRGRFAEAVEAGDVLRQEYSSMLTNPHSFISMVLDELTSKDYAKVIPEEAKLIKNTRAVIAKTLADEYSVSTFYVAYGYLLLIREPGLLDKEGIISIMRRHDEIGSILYTITSI